MSDNSSKKRVNQIKQQQGTEKEPKRHKSTENIPQRVDEIDRLKQENESLKMNERQLTLRCTLLEQQNKILKSRETACKSLLRTTLERVVTIESRLNDLEKYQKQSGPISKMPHEMLFCLLSELPLMDIIWAQSVCKAWQACIGLWLKHLDLFPFYNGVNNQTLHKLSKFSNLQSLALTRCKEITNRGLSVIAKAFPYLVSLDLFGCQVNDFITLHELCYLRHLRIGDSKHIVDKDLEDLPPSLESLKMEWCLNIKNGGLSHLFPLSRLLTLHVGQCDFLKPGGFDVPESVSGSLTDLTLDRQAFFNDQALLGLQGCTNLRKLHFYWLPIQGTTFKFLSSLQGLEHLNLRRCHALTDESLYFITVTLTNLTNLELRGDSKVTNTGLQCLSNLSLLHSLRLRCGKSINDDGLQFLTHLSLTKLHLCDCLNITSETLRLISNTQANTLKKLVFSQSGSITCSSVVQYISKLTNLTHLCLTDCIHVVERLQWKALPDGGFTFADKE